MSNLTKNLLKCSAFLLVLFVVIIIYGLLIGGCSNLLYAVLILTTLLILFVLFGRNLFCKDKIPLLILVVLVTCLISFQTYIQINNTFDSTINRTYITVIEEAPGNVSFRNCYWFYNPEKIMNEYSEFSLISNPRFEIGDKVLVKEYNGAFNIEHYELSKL
jgi:hypothetical protein